MEFPTRQYNEEDYTQEKKTTIEIAKFLIERLILNREIIMN